MGGYFRISSDCFIFVTFVYGVNQNFTDKGLSELTNLQILRCDYNKNFTDEGLKNLTQLETVLYSDGIFTNDGLGKLKNLQLVYNVK